MPTNINFCSIIINKIKFTVPFTMILMIEGKIIYKIQKCIAFHLDQHYIIASSRSALLMSNKAHSRASDLVFFILPYYHLRYLNSCSSNKTYCTSEPLKKLSIVVFATSGYHFSGFQKMTKKRYWTL